MVLLDSTNAMDESEQVWARHQDEQHVAAVSASIVVILCLGNDRPASPRCVQQSAARWRAGCFEPAELGCAALRQLVRARPARDTKWSRRPLWQSRSAFQNHHAMAYATRNDHTVIICRAATGIKFKAEHHLPRESSLTPSRHGAAALRQRARSLRDSRRRQAWRRPRNRGVPDRHAVWLPSGPARGGV